MIRIRCHACPATDHVGADGALPLGWGLTDEGGHQCPSCGDELAVLATAHDVALRMPRGPVTRARLWVQPFPTHPLDGVALFADLAARVGPVSTGLLAGAPRDVSALDHIEDPARPPYLLTFDAEDAGDLPDSPRLRAALTALLRHPYAYVREGAVYGLAKLLQGNGEALAEALAPVLDDASPGVRAAATDAVAWETT